MGDGYHEAGRSWNRFNPPLKFVADRSKAEIRSSP